MTCDMCGAVEHRERPAVSPQHLSRISTGPQTPKRCACIAYYLDCGWYSNGYEEGLVGRQAREKRHCLLIISTFRHQPFEFQLYGNSAERHPFRAGITCRLRKAKEPWRGRTRRYRRQWLPVMVWRPTCDLCCECTSHGSSRTYSTSIGEWCCKARHSACRHCQEGARKLVS